MSSIKDAISQSIILAYKEDTQQLETYLTEQGFDCQVIRQTHQAEYSQYSPSYLCLLNHLSAWQQVVSAQQPILICEADFVPVRNLSTLPLPYDPSLDNVGIAWLYTCAPQIYNVSSTNHAIGFSTSMVAYILTPAGAQHLIQLVDQITEHPGPTQYSTWDSNVEEFLRRRGLNGYVPWRNYGEHGGKPNPEHKKAGLSPAHRADVLYRKLAFNPVYTATQSHPALHVLFSRLKARTKGIGRLLLGKYLRRPVLAESTTPGKMLRFAIGRQLTLRP
ncbi:LPS biosynthesis glycosyltransferase [Halomicronema sp. CCY15110]|uniref:LPS biosynthesis glycosyltransferase n=1 Tax=Halomicronema sp. CCY15110 TaxID=2767773 RepID=UPI00194F1CF0|nr:LPS biosynthesis glycosyltransferase [Halomicronema sp. CCY15110]